MFRPPPRLRGSSPEAAWQNKMRDVVRSLRPIVSRNSKFAHTTIGLVNEGTAEGSEEPTPPSVTGGSAVWL